MIKKELIIPSIRLKHIGVHKIQDKMTCSRLYFWKWVMNLVPKKLNIAFWFGSVMHKGNEFVPLISKLEGKALLDKIYTAMDKESKKASKGYTILPNVKDEMALMIKMGRLMIATYIEIYGKELKSFDLTYLEVPFQKKLKNCPVLFEGTVDALGRKKKANWLKEIKTAARITAEYFARLKFDKQINGYAIGAKEITGAYPAGCDYVVFRKPSIRVKQNESVPQYLKRLKIDLHKRADWYYLKEELRFGKQAIEAVLNDIEWETFDLWSKYNFLTQKQLLNPYNWARNAGACFNFGVCPYFLLCRKCQQYKLYLPLYRMRDIRYTTEKRELSKKIVISTERKSDIKIEEDFGNDESEY